MPRSVLKSLARMSSFLKKERGGTAALSLFMIASCIMIAGLAVDPAKVWEAREELYLAADAGAQAGIVALAQNKTEAEVRAAAVAAVLTNVPPEEDGQMLADPVTDITLVRYDALTRMIVPGSPANAVKVTLRRENSVGNPISTVFLGLAGVPDFETQMTSVAYFGSPARCDSSDGIVARGKVSLSSQNTIGPGYCVHSQTQVWLPQQNTFEPTSGLSMPNLEMCKGKCVNTANPGVEEAVFQMNAKLPDIGAHITAVVTQLRASGSDLKTAVFLNKPLDSDLTPLKAQGVNIDRLVKGSVVTLSQEKFNALTRIPTGLVYDVSCVAKGNGPTAAISIGGKKNGAILLKDLALITNCSLAVGQTAKIENAVIVTTRVSASSVLDASQGATVGDPNMNCDLGKKVYVMAMSGISVNSHFTASNVAFIVNGDINLAAGAAMGGIAHKGTSLIAQGDIHISSSHSFNRCSADGSGLIPGIKTIKLVLPLNVAD